MTHCALKFWLGATSIRTARMTDHYLRRVKNVTKPSLKEKCYLHFLGSVGTCSAGSHVPFSDAQSGPSRRATWRSPSDEELLGVYWRARFLLHDHGFKHRGGKKRRPTFLFSS